MLTISILSTLGSTAVVLCGIWLSLVGIFAGRYVGFAQGWYAETPEEWALVNEAQKELKEKTIFLKFLRSEWYIGFVVFFTLWNYNVLRNCAQIAYAKTFGSWYFNVREHY